MAQSDRDPLAIYESRPPEWLPKAHVSADLGYVGFHPPRSDESEDVLTEHNIQHGYSCPSSVPAETLVFHQPGFIQDNIVTELEALMDMIFARRIEDLPAVPPSSFRLPSRVTLNDAKRQSWFADLANPNVPLHKLGKSVPHGAKGHDLLDLLHSNNVAIPRAVWFLRVFGGNETAGLRNKPNYNPTQYSVDWANVVTGYIKKQLAEIALPSAPRPGLSIKSTFKGVLADNDSRERWISRFTYCLALLRTFYAEGLVDNRTFLAWLVQQMSTCNLAQLGFVARLADEYLDGMLVSRALTRPFVDATLQKLTEIRSASVKLYLGNSEAMLKNLVLRSFLALPDAFVSPRMWLLQSHSLDTLLNDYIAAHASLTDPEHTAATLHETLLEIFSDVKQRNEAMLFYDLPPRMLGGLSSTLSTIKTLNSLSGKTDMDAVDFFGDAPEASSIFSRKLDILLTWSVTPLQYGDHRPYAAACLLRGWRDKAKERAIRRDVANPDEQIQDQLFDWLDSSAAAGDVGNLPAVSLLFGELVRHELFSYAKYMQRLIARGEPGLSFNDHIGSRHRNFIRGIPLHSSSSALISQRKVTLYGVRARETPEDANEREIRKEIRAALPVLFGGDSLPPQTLASLRSNCQALLSAPRYEQVRSVKQWLLPILRKYIASQTEGVTVVDAHVVKTYCVSIVLMAHTRCYGPILDLTLFTLERASTTDILIAVIETLRQHIEVWACMNVSGTIAKALYAVHQSWRTRGLQNRELSTLLIEIDNERYLEPSAREHLLADISAYTHALFPAINEDPDLVPPVLPEILLLATDTNPDAPSILANSLWYKYHTAADWAWKVWDNTIASLRQIPHLIGDDLGRRACALRYATFLTHIDQHLPNGFDEQILNWFLGSGKNEIAALGTDAWDVVTVVLLSLAVHGALATTTILQGLIYPVWLQGSQAASPTPLPLEILLTAVNNLFQLLLLKNDDGNGLPPVDIFEAQGLQTRRRDVFREPYFASLVANFPTLVLVEENQNLPDSVRQASLSLRRSICKISVFRQGIYRDLDAVRHAFEKPLESRDLSDNMHELLVNALRLMLHDNSQDEPVNVVEWQAVSSLLSPWKLAATTIEIRFTLKQLEEGLSHASSRDVASANIDKLTYAVFHHCLTPEEGDFMADMVRGVSVAVAAKFVDAGLHRVSELMKESEGLPSPEDVDIFISKAGEILRLLVHVVDPFRETALSMPPLESMVQDVFITTLLAKLEDLSGNTYQADNNPQISQLVVFMARLLQFDLGFPSAWTTQMRALSEKLSACITELLLRHGSGRMLNTLVFPLLLDTLYYTLDEGATDVKGPAFDPFRNYPQFNLSELAPDMPLDYKTQLRSLMPYTFTAPAVSGLAYASRDASGNMVHTGPVQNRPWEWTEYLGEAPSLEPRNEDRPADERLVVKNTGSLSLEMFGARITGDTIIHRDGTLDPRVESELQTFQDGLSGDVIFERDWRETRIDVDDPRGSTSRSRGDLDHDHAPLPSLTAQGVTLADKRVSSRRASPSSRGSVYPPHTGSSSSLRHMTGSPVQLIFSRMSGSTISDAIDVDNFDVSTSGSQSTQKRKASTDIEVPEAGPSTAKKPRQRTSSKPRTKKR